MTVLLYAGGAGLAILFALLGIELAGWGPHVARAALDRAASVLPPEFQERYREEWLAHVSAYDDRPLSAMVVALSIAASARRLSHELAPAAGAATTRGTVTQRVQRTAASAAKLLTWVVRARIRTRGFWLFMAFMPSVVLLTLKALRVSWVFPGTLASARGIILIGGEVFAGFLAVAVTLRRHSRR